MEGLLSSETEGKKEGVKKDNSRTFQLPGGRHKKDKRTIRLYPEPYQNGVRCDPNVWRQGHTDWVWTDIELDGVWYEHPPPHEQDAKTPFLVRKKPAP